MSLITFYPLHNNILLGAGNPLNRQEGVMYDSKNKYWNNNRKQERFK